MSSDTPLNPRQEKFARLYYAGPEHLRGNGRRCYMKAYELDNPQSADTGASRLLRNEKVRARIRELRDEAAQEAKARARDWWEMYPEAQETLLKAARGKLEFNHPEQLRSAVRAAQEIVSRCEGTAKQVHEHNVQEEGIVVHVAGAPHPPQEEYAQEVEEADYDLVEEAGDEDDENAEELQVRVGGRPSAQWDR